MARLGDGGYVTVWTSETQDGWGYGIYGQRYDAQGVAVGNQFQVNDYTPYDQTEPVVASLDGGGFVVVWRDQGGRDAAAPACSANATTPAACRWARPSWSTAAPAATSTSRPSPAWPVAASSSPGIRTRPGRALLRRLQRFDNNGSPLGTETRANTSAGFTNSAQYEPASRCSATPASS
jgi:hypothetical protein